MRKTACLVGLAVVVGSAGCRQVECGEGTVEDNGVCRLGMPVEPAECGQGFFWEPMSGQCLSTAFQDAGFAICGENTVVVYNDAGIPFCVGTGGADCNSAPPCPSPSGSRVSVCGRIYDIEDTTAADDDPASGGIADVVEILLYEPINFALSPPGTATPLAYEVTVDKCGYYAVNDVSDPGTGFLAFAIDDPEGGAADDFVLTGVAFPIPSPGPYRINAWITRRSTMNLWNTSAGGGIDFEAEGIFVPIFIDPRPAQPLDPFDGVPFPGLKIERVSTVVMADDYYFSDTEQLIRRTIDPAQDATGANGTGFMINSGLETHGAADEPAGCNVIEALAASIPNVVFVSERPAECM